MFSVGGQFAEYLDCTQLCPDAGLERYADLLYLLRFERVDNWGAYGISSRDRRSHPSGNDNLTSGLPVREGLTIE